MIYVSSIEVNSFFWNKGIFKELCENVINFINMNQHILISTESDMGRKYNVVEKFSRILVKNGFRKTIWIDDCSNYHQLYDLICKENKKLEKIR